MQIILHFYLIFLPLFDFDAYGIVFPAILTDNQLAVDKTFAERLSR